MHSLFTKKQRRKRQAYAFAPIAPEREKSSVEVEKRDLKEMLVQHISGRGAKLVPEREKQKRVSAGTRAESATEREQFKGRSSATMRAAWKSAVRTKSAPHATGLEPNLSSTLYPPLSWHEAGRRSALRQFLTANRERDGRFAFR
jgi:hypothetical protein